MEKLFCMYVRGLRYQKQNRMGEETEPQTHTAFILRNQIIFVYHPLIQF